MPLVCTFHNAHIYSSSLDRLLRRGGWHGVPAFSNAIAMSRVFAFGDDVVFDLVC